MRIQPEHFDALGLPPGRYTADEVSRRFERVRARLLAELEGPTQRESARRDLDRAYRARNVLRAAPRSSAAARDEEQERYHQMREAIESSLEDGLLRCSRRKQVLAEGRRLGFSDFHTQLMIAQVQFGDHELLRAINHRPQRERHSATRLAARLSAAGVLGLALFLAMVRWLGV